MKYRQDALRQSQGTRARPPERRRRAAALLTIAACLLTLAVAGLSRPAPAHADALMQLAIQQAQLTAGDGAAGDYFGCSVAVSGDTALVGAYGVDVGGNADQSSAYVFVRSGTTWTQQQKLVADDGAADDHFGISVALSGDTALVGAIGDDETCTDQGSAYVFTRSDGAWTEQQKLTAGDGAGAGDWFGYSVALSGETALVAACSDDVGATDQGSAYVFVRSDGTWTEQQRLTAGDGAGDDWFGWSVALSGETAAVGAYKDDVDGKSNQGSAYVFVRSGDTWTQQQQLKAGDGAAYDYFGSSVALSGETAVVGAPYDDVATTDQGSAFVFLRDGAAWSQQQQLTATDGAAYDYFGSSVALAGDTALVGAISDDVDGQSNQGSASVFVRSGTTWSQQQRLTAAAGAAGDAFGWSVALSGETALVGAPYYVVDGKNDQGSASVFAPDETAPQTAAMLDPAANAAGWNTTPVTVSLTATDPSPGSGVDKTYYRLDHDDPFSVYSAAAKPTVSAEGTTLVEFYSTDLAGNSEFAETKSAPVRIDKTAPTTTAGGIPAGWSKANVTVTLSPSDALSGMIGGSARTEYSTNGGASWTTGTSATISTQGTTTLLYRSTDAAGNIETAKSVSVRLDATAPSTSLPSTAIPQGWGKAPVTVALIPSDALSGMIGGSAKSEYSLDGGATWTTGTSATISAQGQTTLLYRSVDAAGNVERDKSATVRIDSAKPTTRAFKASVKKGKKVKLAYRVSDPTPGCGQATVTLKIYKGKKLKKTIKVKGTCTCNVKKTQSWKCTLAKGR